MIWNCYFVVVIHTWLKDLCEGILSMGGLSDLEGEPTSDASVGEIVSSVVPI